MLVSSAPHSWASHKSGGSNQITALESGAIPSVSRISKDTCQFRHILVPEDSFGSDIHSCGLICDILGGSFFGTQCTSRPTETLPPKYKLGEGESHWCTGAGDTTPAVHKAGANDGICDGRQCV